MYIYVYMGIYIYINTYMYTHIYIYIRIQSLIRRLLVIAVPYISKKTHYIYKKSPT